MFQIQPGTRQVSAAEFMMYGTIDRFHHLTPVASHLSPVASPKHALEKGTGFRLAKIHPIIHLSMGCILTRRALRSAIGGISIPLQQVLAANGPISSCREFCVYFLRRKTAASPPKVSKHSDTGSGTIVALPYAMFVTGVSNPKTRVSWLGESSAAFVWIVMGLARVASLCT